MSRSKHKFRKSVHGAQMDAIAQAAAALPFQLSELGNTYCGPKDRFVVSLIVGYAEDDGVRSARAAGAAALALTTDLGSPDTHWYVFDRQTGEMRQFEQHELEEAQEPEADERIDCKHCGDPIEITEPSTVIDGEHYHDDCAGGAV